MSAERYRLSSYLIRKKIFKLFGGAFHIYGPDGALVFYSKLAAFRLKEDIRLFTGEDMREELLAIRARNIIDFAATYDVFDSQTGERVGALRRKGLKSIIQDEWLILDPADREIGLIQEDSTLLALFRRFVAAIFPQNFRVEIAGRPVAEFRQNWNPFVGKITADFSFDPGFALDRRLGIAAAVLLCAIEGKQG